MSSSPIPFHDERPRSVAGAWEEPCPADGHGVLRLKMEIYELPLMGGRRGHIHLYGSVEAPLAIHAALFDPTAKPPRVALDPELAELFARTGMISPDHEYVPIDPVEAERIRATYRAIAPLFELRESHWVYGRERRERIADGQSLLLERIYHRDLDDEVAIFAISPDRSELTPIDYEEWSSVTAFETAVEGEARLAKEAELAARRASEPDDELPF